jgi:hypothetical protein
VEKAVFDEFIPNIVYFMFEKCNPGWRIQPRTVEDHELTYIIKGNARFVVNGTAHELENGDLLYLNEGDLKEAATTLQNPMQCFTVNFKTKYQKAKNNSGEGGISLHYGQPDRPAAGSYQSVQGTDTQLDGTADRLHYEVARPAYADYQPPIRNPVR